VISPANSGASSDSRLHPRSGRRLLRNFGLLVGGRAGGAVLGLAATALTARGLGAEEFGVVVLVHTYALLFQGLFNPHSFEAVVRFGVGSDGQPRHQLLLSTFLRLDLAVAMLGCIVAVGLVVAARSLLGWSGQASNWAIAYSTIVALSPVATIIGILRLHDRFDLLALQSGIRQVVRFAGVATAFWLQAGPGWYLLAWYLGLLVEQLCLVGWGWRETRRHGQALDLRRARWADLMRQFPGIRRYTAATYGQSLVDLGNKHALTLVVGGVIGAESAGLYRLAREAAKTVAWPVILLREAMLPELARLWPQARSRFLWLTTRTAVGAGAAGVSLWGVVHLYAEPAIRALVGSSYAVAAPLMSWLVAAAALDLLGSPLRPAIFAIGRPGPVFRVNAVSIAVHAALVPLLAEYFGLYGTGIAAVCAAALSLMGLGVILQRQWAGTAANQPGQWRAVGRSSVQKE